ncbi:ABC transporter ATP-binding protein [Marispirochaeta sp.]|jgi:ABC-2 type transport system ATP-binding protein|uniref:ABC transporter ATP-binding protein n=1 Tax=Marispirochaeta sp. TaxID=2038653 RepID=UPI0029C8EE2A|nr:ABC transporter ATP-binding protein [Marispirochaeta sp.]
MISIRSLTRRFGSFTAVDDISFEVRAGEVFGFLGANGAGKTTTIRMMCGLLSPSEGDILVDGISVTGFPEKVKRRIGYMSQKFSLYADLSPVRNIEFFGAVYGVPAQRIADEKQRIGIELGAAAGSSPAGKLPLGYKQRLGLTCALLHEPPIVFLDEPTSGVDPVGRREFWEGIYDHSSAGRTVLITTHFMDEAEYCHRIAIMSRGRVIELDTPEAIKACYGTDSLNEAFIRAVERDREE